MARTLRVHVQRLQIDRPGVLVGGFTAVRAAHHPEVRPFSILTGSAYMVTSAGERWSHARDAKSPQRSKSVAFRVRGLTCSKCVGSPSTRSPACPRLSKWVSGWCPSGFSLITIPAAGSADPAVVRAAILRAGFRVVSSGPMVRDPVDPLEVGWEASA